MKPFAIADLFCGAGGTSTGAVEAITALGYAPRLTAINHWDVAIATHTANHPSARHLCTSLDNVNPRNLFGPGELNFLWASPECQKHSKARRKKKVEAPSDESSRATAWHVTQWAEATAPGIVMVENVPEFRDWRAFGPWCEALASLGYRVDHRVLCAADFGDPTTRRRVFVQAVRGNRRIVWPDPTHSDEPDMFGLKPWVPAADIIDWTIPMRSINGRKKPLADNTLNRIAEGLTEEGVPVIIAMEHGGRVVAYDKPLPTVTCARGGAFGLAYLLPQHGGGKLRPVSRPAPTIAGAGAVSLIVEYYGNGKARPVTEPLPTVTTRDRFALIQARGGDILFRMLKPHELAAAQGFRRDYRFVGNQSQQTKQIGNAVPRRMARALALAVISQQSNVAQFMPALEAQEAA